MMGKEMDPSDIGKHPKYIKMAQNEMAQMDILVCGKCNSVFHFIELFRQHKNEGCSRESSLKDSRETKPKVWAFLLWKASQVDSSLNPSNSWKLYQTWTKLEESVRETWVVAGRTIQSFAKMGQGNLQEMPVKITKTVVDNVAKPIPNVVNNKLVPRNIEPKPVMKKPLDIEEEIAKQETPKIIRKVPQVIAKPAVIQQQVPKIINRRAQRTIPDTSGQEFEEEIVEKIIAKRFNPRRKMHEYLVKWDGFPHDQNTWEPQTHLESCPQLLDTFEKQLARQKEQRAQQAKNAAGGNAGQRTNASATEDSPTGRSSKAKALDQVKQWCADEDSNTNSGGGTKRKIDDSDFETSGAGGEDDDDFDDEDFSPTAKRLRNGNMRGSPASKGDGIKVLQAPKTKAMNGHLKPTQENTSAEIVITKDASAATGVVKKSTSISNSSSQKTEAQVRVVSKNENVASGIVRITGSSPTQRGGVQKAGQMTITRTGQQARISSNMQGPSNNQKITVTTKDGKTVQQTRTLLNSGVSGGVNRTSTPQKTFPKPSPTGVQQRTSLSPGGSHQSLSGTSGKAIVTRVVKSSPTAKSVTPEQKILQLSKSGDLRVTRKVVSHPTQQNAPVAKAIPAPAVEEEEMNVHEEEQREGSESPENPMTLCPVTGKILGGPEEPEPPENVADGEKKVENPAAENLEAAAQQQHADLVAAAGGIALVSDDGQTQQILANEDGTPLLVTGEDGTIYQVAGKNAEGQTILIAQGADGEQQFAYVAAEEGDEGGVLTLDNAVAEAVAHMLPEQQAEALAAAANSGNGEAKFILKQGEEAAGADVTQGLSIQTGESGDSQDGNIPAEVVQADLPSPGGTRRVVLLLQDGTFMMTEMHDDEYQALNIVP